jgi:hypothetical protein
MLSTAVRVVLGVMREVLYCERYEENSGVGWEVCVYLPGSRELDE